MLRHITTAIHAMYKSIDLDAAVELLKNLVDNNRCCACDRTGGTRLRYPCGHACCQDCVVLAEECSLCLTPPQATSKPVIDDPLTQRAANAVNLLNVFENEFHIDVYKRHRISEQLKAEKEVFPECIQAPVKYSNKRKSFNNSKINKENRRSHLPGEEISSIGITKIDKNKNIEMWLNRCVRKPFADLNSNDERLRKDATVLRSKQNIQTENIPIKTTTRKRSHFKSVLSNVNQSLIDLTPVKKARKSDNKSSLAVAPVKLDTSKYVMGLSNTDNDKSGISMDDEAVIVIDDSQSIQVNDKDYNAWLAVHEAERNKILSPSDNNTRSIEITPPKEKSTDTDIKLARKVPFYLVGSLSTQCIDCNSNESIIKNKDIAEPILPTSDTEQANDVSITVENKSFVTIITIKRDQPINRNNSMQSIGVQTKTPEAEPCSKENIENLECESINQDIFHSDRKMTENPEENCINSLNRNKNVVIEESDSEDEIEASVSLEVTAEIHRSCEEVDYGILADIDDLHKHSKRARRGPRGLTPTSTDSSEKENYHPNRMKKTSSKKKPKKK